MWLRGVSDDDTVYSWCTGEDFVDHEFETVTTSGDPCICRSIKLRGGDSSSSSALNRSAFPDRFGPTINRDPITGGSRTHKQKDIRWPRQVLILPASQRVEAELVR